jgi:hypothetical protein
LLQYKEITTPPARVVVAGIPYHVTRRGNRRQDIRFPPAAIRKQDMKKSGHTSKEKGN